MKSSHAVGHCNKNNVIFTAGAQSFMCLVGQWCHFYCDSSSAFDVWWHYHIWGVSTVLFFIYIYIYKQIGISRLAYFGTWWRTTQILFGASISCDNLSLFDISFDRVIVFGIRINTVYEVFAWNSSSVNS